MTFTVFIVDDDVGVLKALGRRLRMRNYSVETFASPSEFLSAHDPDVPGCALLDLAMPGLNGLELQQALRGQGHDRPVIFITGQGDIPTSVRAMRGGAIDFLTKPVADGPLLEAIARAERRDLEDRERLSEVTSIRSLISTLTGREREVLGLVVAGKLSKQIAYELGTVEQTIKVHRRRAMNKLGIRTMLQLAQLVAKVGRL